jgi:hypothetical protein
MFKRFLMTAVALFATTSLFAQDAADLERRLRELEQRIATMQSTPDLTEIKRQIEVLATEVEALKNRQTDKPVSVEVATQAGLGAAASKVYRAGEGISFGGYGEFLYQNLEGNRVDTADVLRAILYTGYKFNDRTIFNSEIEYEHANTERSGQVEVEFAYLDYLIRPSFNVRAGLVLMPVGLINEQHELVDSRILPTTWNELGVGAHGEVGAFSYRGYVTTSLASDTLSATGIRGARQRGSQAKANDFAVVGRVDYRPFEGTMVGGSLYTGNSGQERRYEGRVSLGEVHVDSHFRGVSLRALYARGTIDDVRLINAANALTGNRSVGESFGGWYAEAGYDVAPLIGLGERSLSPYVRYETLDTQRTVPSGFSRNPANDQNLLTIGLAFKPMPQTVLKIDWQDVKNEAGSGVDQWNVALGYIF